MKYLLDMEIDDAGNAIFKTLDDGELAVKAARMKEFFVEEPTYIGSIVHTDADNQFGKLNLKFHEDTPSDLTGKRIAAFKKQLESNDPGVAQMGMQQLGLIRDALVIQHKGNFYLFGVNPLMKNAMAFDNTLNGGVAKFNAFFKRLLTANTVGRYSSFGPTSFIYNASMGTLNSFLRHKGGMMEAGADAIQVWRDGVKGAVDILTTDVADDFVQLLTHTIETNIGMGKSHPALLKKMRDTLQARVKKSMIHDFRLQTGSVGAGGQSADEFSKGIAQGMGSTVPYINKVYGGNIFPQFVRTWDHINASLHEGVAYGVALRKLGGTTNKKTANQIRIAKRQSADLVGNNKLKGASEVAKQLNAALPFYGATLQGFSTLGRAVAQARMQTITKLTVAVGMPVAVEVAYNSLSMGKEEYPDVDGKMWTHNTWYWKGLNQHQRASNIHVPKPGQPPWDAFVRPVVPEIAAIRSIYIDALEVIFGLSDEARFSADHIAAGFGNAMNVPLPPWIKAGLSAFGVDVRAGISTEGSDGLTAIQQRGLPKPNRQTPNIERARFEGGDLSVRFQAVVQDLGGTLATIGLKVYNSFVSGDENTPTSEKVQAGFDQLGKSVLESARYAGGLFGVPVLRASGDPEVSSRVFKKEEALKHWATVQKTQETGGTMSGNFPKQGRTSKVTLDPVTQALAAEVVSIIGQAAPYKIEISNLNKRINSMQHSLVNTFDEGVRGLPVGPITVVQRDQLIDSYKLQIDNYKRILDGIYKQREELFALKMGQTLGRNMSGFTFEGWKDRANPDSASPVPPTPPQTSQ
jgi:hypothetical protein